MNTAVLTGRQVSQGMKVFIVSQAGTVADVTLQSSCHSEDESVLKVNALINAAVIEMSDIVDIGNVRFISQYYQSKHSMKANEPCDIAFSFSPDQTSSRYQKANHSSFFHPYFLIHSLGILFVQQRLRRWLGNSWIK